MITNLIIKDYESHKDTSLEFPPGLTVFIGESDKGKSGTFRAFNWLRTNKPGGNSMFPLYWDSKTTDVIVETEEGFRIRRSKGKSINSYETIDNVGEEWESNAGTSVPTEVSDLLLMEDDIYFQSQIDRPFLMFETPGERGRILNKIAGLDKIDSCIKNASQDVRRIKTKRGNIKYEIQQIEEELLLFNDLPEINDLLIQAEILDKKIIQQSKLLSTVESLLPKKKKLQLVLEKETILEEISKKVSILASKLEKVETYKRVLGKVRALKFRRKELKERYNKESILTTISSSIEELEKSLEKYELLEVKYDKANELLFQWDKRDNRISEIESKIERIKKELPDTCPTCGELLK